VGCGGRLERDPDALIMIVMAFVNDMRTKSIMIMKINRMPTG
jgi:hypothetical protein